MLYLNPIEKRITLLYILNQCKTSLSNEMLTTTVIETTPINWIETQTVINSLFEDNLIRVNQNLIEITPEGEKVVLTYLNKIPETIRKSINSYIETKIDSLIESSNIIANLRKTGTSYEVKLELIELDEKLIQLKLLIPDRKLAESICKKWKENSSEIYREIIQTII